MHTPFWVSLMEMRWDPAELCKSKAGARNPKNKNKKEEEEENNLQQSHQINFLLL